MSNKNPALSFSKLILELKPAETFRYSRLAAELVKRGKTVVSLGIGEPDFPTPRHIVDAAIKALKDGFTHYVPPQGIPELRAEIARYVSDFTRAGDVEPEETLVLPGAKQALSMVIASYIEPGDEVIIPDPGFYSYDHLTKYAGGQSVFVSLKEENDFRMLSEDVQTAVTNKTKMIILNSPHNPTGSVLAKADVREILKIARDNGVLVVSDEVYDHYIYEGRFTSVLADPQWRDFIIYINSLSKTYSMTGWRIGYVVANSEVITRLSLFAANSFSCTTAFVQKAGVAALKGPQDFFQSVLQEYRKRRNFIYNALDKIDGVRLVRPAGAFYVFPNIKEILEDRDVSTEEFTMQLLKEKGVVTLPGSAFPHEAGRGYLRVSYAAPIGDLEKGVDGFEEFLASGKPTTR